MKAKKQGYTLFELVIVIGIVIILMGLTMRFGSSRIDDLQRQTSKEELKNSYEQLLLGNMSSNYYNNERYEKIIINFQSGGNGFSYNLIAGDQKKQYTGFFDIKQKITAISINEIIQKDVSIILRPYILGCQILTDENQSVVQTQNTLKNEELNDQEIVIQIEKNFQKSCFGINTNMCKIENRKCNYTAPL